MRKLSVCASHTKFRQMTAFRGIRPKDRQIELAARNYQRLLELRTPLKLNRANPPIKLIFPTKTKSYFY
ncbi:hypothetical protein OUZ56_016096 [Daphnia magna]|uniref:Uncharacterized protein n=1 Tax=Daphnia magna TaxID=35525 RepID=A0ABR0APP1_9CRUS|nr:hypothetical protein OUZ56_016096 [Daphnia magna]